MFIVGESDGYRLFIDNPLQMGFYLSSISGEFNQQCMHNKFLCYLTTCIKGTITYYMLAG